MKLQTYLLLLVCLVLTSCVSTKQFEEMENSYQNKLAVANEKLGKTDKKFNEYLSQIEKCEKDLTSVKANYEIGLITIKSRDEQIQDLRAQIADFKAQRDKQMTQVGDLTVLSQTANTNIKETLNQLDRKDKYIQLLQAAKTKADSINLALAINLKSVLKEGLDDKDIEIRVEKTVVFINLSDKMLYQSGSANLTQRANEVLGKIATIVESRPELEVMVEGYTDNVPIKNTCLEDNWDLSVKRATSVVRVLQKIYGINPNRLIAAGRGEFNTLADNSTDAGRTINRRTRIIILPKLNQFYDLLNPTNMPK